LCFTGKKKGGVLQAEGFNGNSITHAYKFPCQTFIICGQSPAQRVCGSDYDDSFIQNFKIINQPKLEFKTKL
jgi:hypothetical protein